MVQARTRAIITWGSNDYSVPVIPVETGWTAGDVLAYLLGLHPDLRRFRLRLFTAGTEIPDSGLIQPGLAYELRDADAI